MNQHLWTNTYEPTYFKADDKEVKPWIKAFQTI